MTTSTDAVPRPRQAGTQTTAPLNPDPDPDPAEATPAVTAAAFLFGDGLEHGTAALEQTLEQVLSQSGAFAQAQSRLGSVGDSVWAGAHRELAAMASDFLALDLASVLLAGWRKCRELQEAAESTRGTAAAAVVPLGSRHISLVQHPSIDLVLGKATVPAVRFELKVDVDVLGVAGRVRDGALVALEGGHCDATVSFSAEGRCLAERRGELDPRLSIPLGRGVPLPRGPRGAQGEADDAFRSASATGPSTS